MSVSKKRLLTAVKILHTSATTVGLASLGTMALVSAHHLGRKQYDEKARLTDYSDGLLKALKAAKTKRHPIQPQKGSAATVDSNNPPLLTPSWISGVADLKTNEFGVVGINSDRQIIWQTPMPERVHDILIQPAQPINQAPNNNVENHVADEYGGEKPVGGRHVAVMGRRPSEWFWILDSVTGKILFRIKAQPERHFYGHACYDLSGKTLYVTENHTTRFAGMIGVYDIASGYQKVNEFASYGIGPHELLMHPDGDTLVIANGGIKTERASRDELNIDSMQPSLVYVNRHSGALLEQVFPEHNQMSVRHLSMGDNGTVAIGIQFQGEPHLSVPLILTHKRGDLKMTPLQLPANDKKGWHRFHHYIASVVVDSHSHLLCATSPIGGCAAIFDLETGKMIDEVALPDCAGVSIYSQSNIPSFLVSDGQGYLTKLGVDNQSNQDSQNDNGSEKLLIADKVHRPMAFDNHLKQLQ